MNASEFLKHNKFWVGIGGLVAVGAVAWGALFLPARGKNGQSLQDQESKVRTVAG